MSSSNAPRVLYNSDLYQWDIVDVNKSRITARFFADTASLSPDGCFIALFDCGISTCQVNITNSVISHTAHIYSKPITTIAFSPDSTRLFAMAEDGQAHIWDLEALHHGDPGHPASISPSDRMMVQLYPDEMTSNGWFYGGNGARLLWLPHDMRKVHLATGIEDCCLLVQHGGSNMAILDMKDYSKVPQVCRAWWKGGIRFVDDEWEVSLARYLERLPVTQELTRVGQKREHESYSEAVGQGSSLRAEPEQTKRLRLEA
jgi:WD40 repeat protein